MINSRKKDSMKRMDAFRRLRSGNLKRLGLVFALGAAGLSAPPAARAIVNPAGEFPGQNSDPADTRLDACGAFSFTTWLTGAPYLVGSPKAVSGITLSGADPVRVSVSNHGYSTGFDVIFQNVAGTTGLNGNTYRITVADTNSFTLNGTVSSQFAPYVSGGTSQQMTSQTDNWYGGAELIAPQLIVTAKHNLNGATDASQIAAGLYSVRFRRQPGGTVQYLSSDPGTGRVYPFSVKVRKWVALPSPDIAIGILESPVPHIAPLGVEMARPSAGRAIVLAGWGSYSQTQGAGSPRDGLRDSGSTPYKTIQSSSSSSVTWVQSFSKPMTSFAVNMHDSGGAVLGLSGTNLAYLGCIVSFGGATGLNQFSAATFGKWLQGQVYTVTFRTDGTPGASLTGWVSQVVLNTGSESCEPVSAAAPYGYRFARWSNAGSPLSTNNPVTISPVAQTMTLTAEFEPDPLVPWYDLAYSAAAGGALEGSLAQSVPTGGSGTPVTAVPNPGYAFTGWSDGASGNPRTDSAVTGSVSVTAAFAPIRPVTATFDAESPGASAWTTLNLDWSPTPYLRAATNGQTGFRVTTNDLYGHPGRSILVDPEAATPSVTPAAHHVAGALPLGAADPATFTFRFNFQNGWYSLTGVGLQGGLRGIEPATDTRIFDGPTLVIGNGTLGNNPSTPGNLHRIGFRPDRVSGALQWSGGLLPSSGPAWNPDRPSTGAWDKVWYEVRIDLDPNGSHPGNAAGETGSGSVWIRNVTENSGWHPVTNFESYGATVPLRFSAARGGLRDFNGFFAQSYQAAAQMDSFSYGYGAHYAVSYAAGAGGSIAGSEWQSVAHGADGESVRAVPAEGYHFVRWSDGSLQNPRTDTVLVGEQSVSAVFAALPGFTAILPRAAGGMELEWTATGGLRYRIQYSDGAAGGGYSGAFTDLVRTPELETAPFPGGVVGTMSFLDDGTAAPPPVNAARTYRIRFLPPDGG